MNKYKWQITNDVAFEKETNTSFNVNADSEYSARFKQYLADGGQVDLADPEPTPVKKWTPFEFRNKFTQAERIAILNSSDLIVKDLWSGFSTAQEVIADYTETIQGMNYLVSVGLLTEARKNEILT